MIETVHEVTLLLLQVLTLCLMRLIESWIIVNVIVVIFSHAKLLLHCLMKLFKQFNKLYSLLFYDFAICYVNVIVLFLLILIVLVDLNLRTFSIIFHVVPFVVVFFQLWLFRDEISDFLQ